MKLRVGLMLVVCALTPPPVRAQTIPSATVLRIEPGADPVCVQVEAALSRERFLLAPDRGYAQHAAQLGLDPASNQAMAAVAPQTGVDVVVVPLSSDGASVNLALWSGRTGQNMGQLQVPLQGGMLGFAGQRQLAQYVRARLGLAAPPRAAPPTAAPPSAAPAPAWQRAPSRMQPQDVGPETSDDEDDLAGIDVRLSAGAGMGMRSLEFPTEVDPTLVDLGPFAVLHVDAAVAFSFGETFAFGPQLSYTTSFMHDVDEVHLDGPKRRMAVRSHRFEASFVPELRLNDDGTMRLSLAIGYAVRSLHPEVHHLLTPFYSLSGPMARLTFRIPFGDDAALRLGPEGQLIMVVSDELQELGVEGSGIAVGGEAAIEVRVSDGVWTELAYRESHALLSSSLGDGATDVERYVTLRVVGVP